jgi:Holliday junction resolvase RusA-like endonuclease
MSLPPNLKTNCGWPAELGGHKKQDDPMPSKDKPKRKTKAEWLAAYMRTPPAPKQTEDERFAQRALFERHDTATIQIRLPLSPSANGLKSIRQAPGKQPFLVSSTQYIAYAEAVARFWKAHYNGWPPPPLTGRLRVLAIVHMARNDGDVANREKALCDALTECGAWADDGLIDDIHFIRGDVIPGIGALDVVIEVIS